MDVIEPQKIEPEVSIDDPTPKSSDSFRDLNFLSLKGYFNVEKPDVDEESAMNYIYDFFEKMDSRSMAETIIGIRSVESKLGAVPLGESRIIAIKNYLKTLSQIEDLNIIKKSMERYV